MKNKLEKNKLLSMPHKRVKLSIENGIIYSKV